MDYNRIQKECFWDLNISISEINQFIHSKNERMKRIIFEKLLFNSSKVFLDLKLFNFEDITEYLNKIEIPTFNKDYFLRRKNLADVYFLNKELLIDELKWVE